MVNALKKLEVRAGIEPTYADLQSAASPLCHRTRLGVYISRRRDSGQATRPRSPPAVPGREENRACWRRRRAGRIWRRNKNAAPTRPGPPDMDVSAIDYTDARNRM